MSKTKTYYEENFRLYCYVYENNTYKVCPFWKINTSFPPQRNGECLLYNETDAENPGVALLWDQCSLPACTMDFPKELPNFKDIFKFYKRNSK